MKPDIRQFLEEIMAINPGMAGMGSASSAILGTTGTEGASGVRLHNDALAFAREVSSSQSNYERLMALGKALEGSLLTVKMISGIADEKLERLVATLHEFMPKDQA